MQGKWDNSANHIRYIVKEKEKLDVVESRHWFEFLSRRA